MQKFRVFIYLGFSAFALMAFRGEGTSGDDPYKGMAKDMCSCFNDATSGLSKKGRKIIEGANGDGEKLQKALEDYAKKSPAKAMHDGEVLMAIGEGGVNECVGALEIKYSGVYTDASEKEIQDRLISKMKGIKSCRLTYTFVMMGLKSN